MIARVIKGDRSDALEISSATTESVLLQYELLGINEARAMRELLTLRSMGEPIVVSFTQASLEAQNCLLKAIEEIDDESIITFVCPHPSTMLPTFLSRCIIELGEDVGSSCANNFVAMDNTARRRVCEDIITRDDVSGVYGLLNSVESELHIHIHDQDASSSNSVIYEVLRTRRLLGTREISTKMALEHMMAIVPVID